MTDASAASSAPAGRAAILDAFLALLAERPFEAIGLSDVAERAGVSLSDLRGSFGSTFDMLSGFVKDVDRRVLDATAADAAEEGELALAASSRDRLFEVLMRRLDVLAPHRAAIRSLARSAARNPMFALALNRLSVRSQQWMLAAAGIGTSGLRGGVRAQGLAVAFARVLRTFLDDTDPSLARTMAALDRELASGERMLGLLDGVCRLARCGDRGAGTRRRRSEDEAPAAAI